MQRYVHGPGFDNPIAWYEGSGINSSTRRFLMADERGSVVSVTDSAGATIAINSYDEYGIPAPTNVGRFGYTGQIWLPELKLWYYKARMYSPTLGRFLQTDPIGYGDGMNWYDYVGGDPVNFVDPLGLSRRDESCSQGPDDICARGQRNDDCETGVCGSSAALRVVTVPFGMQMFGGGGGGGEGESPVDCAGYETLRGLLSFTGSASDVLGVINDVVARTPAAMTPHAKALDILERVGLGGSAAIGVTLGIVYGDGRSAAQGVSNALSGSIVAAGYKKITKWADVGSGKGNDLVADILSAVLPAHVDLGSNGPCAK